MSTPGPVRLSPAVQKARTESRPVVALESSVLAQGLPIPTNRDAHVRMSRAIEQRGATPAVTGIASGIPTLGLEPHELERFLQRSGVRKVSARELGLAIAERADGATTVAATLVLARLGDVEVMATGGIGGVHRVLPAAHPATTVRDESADLVELARSRLVVVCSGAKSILDLPATWERLETLGIPVLGYRTDELPGFFTAKTGIRLASCVESVTQIAAVARAHWSVGNRQSVLVVQSPPAEYALSGARMEMAVERALMEAERNGIHGAAVTPFLLEAVSRFTEGRSLDVNLALLEQNSALAAEIACTLHTTRATSEQRSREV